jgi:hypothetical protein
MANELRTEVEQVKQQEDVQRALKQTSTIKPEDQPKAETIIIEGVQMKNLFRKFAEITSEAVGSSWAFISAVAIIMLWAVTGSIGI